MSNMLEKLQTFLINIAIIQGRHYIWPNINSAVLVKIDNQKKCTAVKYNSNCPYYNEFSSTLEKLVDKTITLTVIIPGSICRKRKILGCIKFDVGTVWFQQDHQFYHKWAILSAPSKEFTSGTRGFLKVDVSIVFKGQVPKIPQVSNTDEIEGNLLLPDGITTERQRVNFIFDVYRGVDLIKKNPLRESGKKFENPPVSYIEISFAGFKIRTSSKKNNSSPVWGERLIIPELFPPLSQRFRIELFHGDSGKKTLRYLNLLSISNDKEEGFLPTFGPTFLHFYSPNNLEGYLGKILICLETRLLGNLLENEVRADLSVEQAPLIDENIYLRYEEVILFAAIFDVSCINKKFNDKAISFRIACGPFQKELDDTGDKISSAITPPMKPNISSKYLCFLPLEENKPCLHLTLSLPDTRKRMYNYNLLSKIANELKSRLDKIEDIFNNKDSLLPNYETEVLLTNSLDMIMSAGGKYIDIVSSYNVTEDPILDQERLKMSVKEMEAVIEIAKNVCKDAKNKKEIFQKIEELYGRIAALIDDVEDWPLVYLWMIYGSKRVAYAIIKPKNIIYSVIHEETGIKCGAFQTIYFQSEENQNVNEFISMVCKVNAILWMGLDRHWNNYQKNMIQGFIPSSETIPRILIAEKKYCRVHIFQGRFAPGSDTSGLCDPFLQVIVGGQCRQTQVLKKTLNPVWDKTLFFKQVILYGSKEFIRNNPPAVFVDIHDKDECRKVELVGRTEIKPTIKMAEEAYCLPKFPPKLSWYQIYNKFNVNAEILAMAELLELTGLPSDQKENLEVMPIPSDIKPNLVNHRIEVVFWGVRNLKKIQMIQMNKPKFVIECANTVLTSDTLINAKKNLNFTNPIKIFEAAIPDQEEYAPPLTIKMYDCRNFGINVFAGTHIVPLHSFFYKPLTLEERKQKFMDAKIISYYELPSIETIISKFETENDEPQEKIETEKKTLLTKLREIFRCTGRKKKIEKEPSQFSDDEEWIEVDDFDWWTKFYASMEETSVEGRMLPCNKHKLKIYQNELEYQPEFENFSDILYSFPMYKGKRTGDETVDEENTTGVLKGSLKIYQWPPAKDFVTASGLPLDKGVFQDFPSNISVRFVLRVYCVRALGLRPKDLNGKSDPYLCITLNNQAVKDVDNYIAGQVNPIFGRCFEFNGVFPQDHSLTVAIFDHDKTTTDDLIGETKIDLENRFYTRHRAHCGLAENYERSGYCQWRDQQKPTSILDGLCRKWNIPDPEYRETSVVVAYNEFTPEGFIRSNDIDYDHQVLALAALKRWEEIPVVGSVLVPEHVETRSLFNPNKPGIEQGKLQLWIDILPFGDLPTPKQVNISPRKPLPFELRVIIWNAEGIPLDEDDFFTGEKKSDIYVKGWLTSPENSQYTDVHYRSLSGEANFNWRFIFDFDYLSTENKIVLKDKSIFGFDEVESKIPCQLTLQVWDNDTISPDDFLGTLTLEISRLPRGAPSPKLCSLSILHPNAPVVNLFKIRRARGWWPLKSVDPDTQKEIYAGALEAEIELLTMEDAEKCPAGIGRDEPQGLSKPNRPDTSFSWFRNPLKAFKYVMKLHKWKFIKIGLFLLLALIIFGAFYAFPGYTVKKILHT